MYVDIIKLKKIYRVTLKIVLWQWFAINTKYQNLRRLKVVSCYMPLNVLIFHFNPSLKTMLRVINTCRTHAVLRIVPANIVSFNQFLLIFNE